MALLTGLSIRSDGPSFLGGAGYAHALYPAICRGRYNFSDPFASALNVCANDGLKKDGALVRNDNELDAIKKQYEYHRRRCIMRHFHRKRNTKFAQPLRWLRECKFGNFWEEREDLDEDGYSDNPDWLVGAD